MVKQPLLNVWEWTFRDTKLITYIDAYNPLMSFNPEPPRDTTSFVVSLSNGALVVAHWMSARVLKVILVKVKH